MKRKPAKLDISNIAGNRNQLMFRNLRFRSISKERIQTLRGYKRMANTTSVHLTYSSFESIIRSCAIACLLIYCVSITAQTTYTSNAGSPHFIPVESGSLEGAGSAAFNAHLNQPGGQTLCLPQSANRPVFYGGVRLVNSRYNWTYRCDTEPDENDVVNPVSPIDISGCPSPFTKQADGSCSLECPAGKEYDPLTGSCREEPDCECDKTPNPIDFVGGEKHKDIVLYRGQGAFPLRLEFHYNNLRNLMRGEGGTVEDPSVPLGGASGTTHTTPPLGSTEYERDVQFTPSLPDATGVLEEFNGNVHRKWRQYYDRLLLPAFSIPGHKDETEIPDIVRLFSFDGETENYVYNNGVYEPVNAYGSHIERLDETHPVAPFGWQVVNGNNEIETYSLNGKLLKITSPSGLTHHLIYDVTIGKNLVEVQDDFGHSINFHYEDVTDPSIVTRVTDPDGNDYLISYTARAMISSITFPDLTPGNNADNPTIQYLYQDSSFPDSITDIIDENGNLAEHYEYDSSGRAILSELAGEAESVSVIYDDNSNTRTLTDILGLQTTYHLNGERLFSSVERLSTNSSLVPLQTQSFSYDGFNNLASEVDWNGNQTTFVRDGRGLELSRTEAVGTGQERTITTSWHSTLRLPTQVVEPGRTTNLTYDANGNLLTRTETDTTSTSVPYSTNGRTRTWTYTYYPEGSSGQFLVHTMDGPRTDVSDVTTYTYTAEGFVATVTNAMSHTTQVTSYNSRGLPLSMTDANGAVTEMTYHPRGWLLSSTVKDPQGGDDAVTTYDYDNVGQLIKVTLPNGAFLSYEYDAAHRLTAISNNLGERQEYTLDAVGNIVQEDVKSASGTITRTQSMVYDELSRIFQVVGGAGQVAQMSYDANGNETASVLDPSGLNQSTIQTFDALDRLTTVTDALNNDSTFTYDARDNLVSVSDQRGLTTTYTYDGLNNLIQLDSPDTGITVYTYDDAGNQLSQTDARGVVTNYSYDALNRLTAVTYPSSPGENIAYSYDQPAGVFGVGRLTQITDQTGTTSYVYDHRGNQVESTVTIQGNSYATQYAYDLADNLIQTIYPSGRLVNHQLDSLGRTAAITTLQNASAPSETLAGSISYLPFGPMQGLTYGNNLGLSIGNDQDYRITGIDVTDQGGTNPTVMGLSYTHNAVDNITAIADAVNPSASQSFVYDALNRLEDATGAYGNQAFAYDAVGNRTSLIHTQDGNTVTETYTYDQSSNRLLSVDKDGVLRNIQYDANGNVITDDRGADTGFDFEYNDQNRLLNATPAGAPQ